MSLCMANGYLVLSSISLILRTSNRYPLGGNSKKGSHVYFLLQVYFVILLFDINVVLMPTMVI